MVIDVDGRLSLAVDSPRPSSNEDNEGDEGGDNEEWLLLWYRKIGFDNGEIVKRRMTNIASNVTFGIICFGLFFPNMSSITWNFIFERSEREKEGEKNQWSCLA